MLIKLYYDNGTISTTRVNPNVTMEEVENFFFGVSFDLSPTLKEDFHKCIKVERVQFDRKGRVIPV